MELVLASGSPRRRELLSIITTEFTVCPTEIDETLAPDEPAYHAVVRLSTLKAEAAHKKHPDTVCIGSDTVVVLDDKILGKPKDEREAEEMLRRMRGRRHTVFTGLAVKPMDESPTTLYTQTQVLFRDFTDDELFKYIATGEPMDKAGAYGIQGRGALLVDGISGDYYSVVGLPISRLYVALQMIEERYQIKLLKGAVCCAEGTI